MKLLGLLRALILMLAAGLVLQGCQVSNKEPLNKHEGPKVIENGPEKELSPEKMTAAEVKQELEKFLTMSSDGKADQTASLNAYSRLVFNQTWLAQNRKKDSVLLGKTLSQFHRQLLAQLRNPELAQATAQAPLIAAYKNALLSGCSEKLDDCINLDFFRLDSQSVTMAAWFAAQENNPIVRFTLYKIAYSLALGTKSQFLVEAVYRDSALLFKSFLTISKTEGRSRLVLTNTTTDGKQTLDSWIRFFATALIEVDPESKLELSEGDLNLWFQWLNAQNAPDIFTPALVARMMDLMSAQLETPTGQKILNDFINEGRSENANTVLAIAKNLQANQKSLVEKLAIADELKMLGELKSVEDLFTVYFVDQLFSKRPLTELQMYWNKSNQDAVFVQRVLRAVVLTRFIDLTLKTHDNIGRYFLRIIAEGRGQDELFRRTLDHSDSTSKADWAQFFSQHQRVKKFFQDNYDNGIVNLDDSEKSKQTLLTRNMFLSLPENVKYLVEYPNMIMMGFYASKLQYSETFYYFGEKITIEYRGYLKSLMDGAMPPMFRYVHDVEPSVIRRALNSLEMSWTFAYTIMLNLPELYQVEMAEFLEIFLRGTLADFDEKIDNKWNKEIENLVKSKTQETLDICRSLENGTAQNRVIGNGRKLKTLNGITYMGLGGFKVADPFASFIATFDVPKEKMQSSFDEYLEIIRSDIDPLIHKMRLIQEVVHKFSNSASAIEKIDTIVNQSMQLKSLRFAQAKKLIEQSLPCALQVLGLEKSRRRALVNQEFSYYEEIFAALERVQADPSQLEAANEALKQVYDSAFFERNAEFKNDYATNSGLKINAQGKVVFKYRPVDFALRVASRIQNNPEFQKQGRISFDIPVNLRTLNESVNGFVTNPMLAKEFQIEGNGSRETKLANFKNRLFFYIQNEIAPIDGQGRITGTGWFDDDGLTVRLLRNLLKTRTALFKYEMTELTKTEQTPAQNQNWKKDIQAGFEALTEDVLSVLEHLSLTNEDRQLLGLLNRKDLFGPTGIDATNYLFTENYPHYRFTGVMDEIFTALTSIRLGRGAVFRDLRPSAEFTWKSPEVEATGNRNQAHKIIPPRLHKFNQGHKYYDTFRRESQLILFPLPEDLSRSIRNSYTWPIEGDYLLADKFIEFSKNWASGNQVPLAQFNTRFNAVTPDFLTADLVRAYQNQIIRYHQDTGEVFTSYKSPKAP